MFKPIVVFHFCKQPSIFDLKELIPSFTLGPFESLLSPHKGFTAIEVQFVAFSFC